MDSNLVSDLLSSSEGSGGVTAAASLKSYTDKFNELFPLYLAIGMTEEQYWDKDCMLVTYYRKAEELKSNHRNQEMWLQGAYFYDALCRMSPVLRAFAKKGAKPLPYPSEPYPITNEQVKIKESQYDKSVYNKGKALMQGFMARNNRKFEGK